MNDAYEKLLEATRIEREAIQQEIAQLNVKREELAAKVKTYDRVLNAANTNGKPPVKKASRKEDWRVSSARIEQLYELMLVQADGDSTFEFTVKGLAEELGVTATTTSHTLHVLHEQGRVRLIRKKQQQRFWGVVA
jgi:hypothetical protein